MPEPPQVRFGPFEVDLHTRELRKHGVRLKLQEQPLQVLEALIERPGELITREELQRRLWRGDTFVDFDQSLNRAVNKLRSALGDEAETPRFIETLPRRGYRFIAAVEKRGRPEPQAPARAASHSRIVLAAIVLLVAAAISYFGKTNGSATDSDQRVIPFTADAGVETMPAFSPDGLHVAFVRTERDPQPWRGFWDLYLCPSNIYIKPVDGSASVQLTKGPVSDSFPVWSPDGQYIAFFRRNQAGNNGYYVVPSVGGPERLILQTRAGSGGLAWFADSTHLAVSEISAASQAHLLAIPIDGGGARVLTAPQRGLDLFPAFSPDGHWLAFVRGVDYSHADVYLMPAKGGTVRQLTFDRVWKHSIAWTPDGDEIVYSSERLWRVPMRGGSPRAIPTMDYVGQIAVAPRGQRMAYAAYSPRNSLWRLEPPQSNTPGVHEAEFFASTRDQDDAQYSPDGRRVAFQSGRSGRYDIWVAGADGGRAMQLSNLGHAGSPSWSADGRAIAFDARLNGNPDIWVISGEGGAPRRITSGPDEDVVPSWSHDGKWIYFASDRSSQFQIWKVSAAGENPSHPAVQVTHGGGFGARESADGRYLYFSRGRGIPGLWRVAIGDGGDAREEQVMADVRHWGWWAITSDGIFSFAEVGSKTALIESTLDGRFRRRAALLDSDVDENSRAITVSADRRSVIYTRNKPDNADIMLVQHFR